MTVRERILSLKLMEKKEVNSKLLNEIGVTVDMVTKKNKNMLQENSSKKNNSKEVIL